MSQLSPAVPLPAALLERSDAPARPSGWRWGLDCVVLAKPRIVLMVLLAAGAGYAVAGAGSIDGARLAATLLGTALAAAGAGALNQVLERELDARMHRTQDRPLAAGRLRPRPVLLAGSALAVTGVAWLALTVNALAAVLAGLTLVTYLLIYTPLKRRTSLATLAGAIPGALPPLAGAAAARGEIVLEGLVLFGILFLWQVPHFLAIGWLYREDYRRGGFPLLAGLDPSGSLTARQALVYSLALWAMSLQPAILGFAGAGYLLAALVLGVLFIGFVLAFARSRTKLRARALFRASIIYLPLLLAALMLDRPLT